jgi:hypothetical protein
MPKTHLPIVLAAAIPVLFLAACGEVVHLEPMRTEPIGIDVGKSERANVELDMGAGELNVNGGSAKLIDGEFEFNVSSIQPMVESSVNGSHAVITVREPHHGGIHSGGVRNRWSLRLNDRVLFDLSINCGAGKAQLDLGSLDLRTLEVHMGAGQMDLDLRGHPTRDYDVNIAGGVGQATIHLPPDVGVRAEAHGGLGSVEVTGLEKEGDHYENKLYDKSKVNIRLNVNGGVGQIRILD